MLRLINSLTGVLLRTATFLFPTCILVMPHFGEVLFKLLGASGAVCLLCNDIRHYARHRIRLVTLLTVGFFAAALLSACLSLDDMAGFRRLEKSAHFLVAPFLAVLFSRLKISARFMLASVKVAALTVSVVAFTQYLPDGARAGGSVNALVFGYLALLLGYFALLRYPLESVSARLFSLLAFYSGCMATVLSQSRGAWLTAFVLLAGVLLYWQCAGVLSRRVAVQVGGAFGLLVLAVCSTSLVQQRAGSAVAQYRVCHESGACNSSVGQRLVMWESGLRAAMQHPVLGWGLHRTQQAAVTQVDNPAIRQVMLSYTHLHNEYINTLVGKGVVGLFSLLLMLGVPFILHLRQAREQGMLAVNGVGCVLCSGYALAGMSNLAFGHAIMNAFFVYFIALTLPMAESSLLAVHRTPCRGAAAI